jgi:hypothetical protein
MKNVLAENLLRFGAKNLSESDIKKLQEQEKGKLSGNTAAALQMIPDLVIKPGTAPNTTFLQTNGLQESLVKYLGGQRSMLNGILGKQILFFKDKNLLNQDNVSKGVYLENGNTDTILAGAFVPRAWYIGSAYPQNLENASQHYLYLFNQEVTTNYSGDITKPFIEKDGNSAQELAPSNANLIVPTKGGADAKLPYVDDNKNIEKALIVTKLKPITDYIRIRIIDGYCPEYKGYANYLLYVGFPKFGSMVGVNKIA